jgi:hypothetical protein
MSPAPSPAGFANLVGPDLIVIALIMLVCGLPYVNYLRRLPHLWRKAISILTDELSALQSFLCPRDRIVSRAVGDAARNVDAAGTRLWVVEKGICETSEDSRRSTTSGQCHILAITQESYWTRQREIRCSVRLSYGRISQVKWHRTKNFVSRFSRCSRSGPWSSFSMLRSEEKTNRIE